MRRSWRTAWAALHVAAGIALVGLAACGAGDRARDPDNAADTGAVAVPATRGTVREQPGPARSPADVARAAIPAEPSRTAGDAYGPFVTTSRPQGEEATRLAVAGERLFRRHECTRCHTLGDGYREGPDLGDVALRREYEWIILMLTEPQYMVQADPDARQLLAEHFEAMPDLELSEDAARAIYAYLAREARAR